MDLSWKKSKDCTGATNCIEFLKADDFVYLRNNKVPSEVIFMTLEEWSIFVKDVKEDNYND